MVALPSQLDQTERQHAEVLLDLTQSLASHRRTRRSCTAHRPSDDIDVKDGKYGRPETPGIASLIIGIAHLHREDEARIAQESSLFDALYECMAKLRR